MRTARMGSYLRQHDVIMSQSPDRWWLGSPMGNGRMGGMVYFPGHFEVLLNKLDIWTCCPSESTLLPHREILRLLKQGDWSRTLKAFKGEKGSGGSTPKRAGRLRFYDNAAGTPVVPKSYGQRLSLAQGRLTTTWTTPTSHAHVETLYDMDQNVLCLRLRDSHLAGKAIELERAAEKGLGKRTFHRDASMLWVDYRFEDGFRYVMALALDASIVRVIRGRDTLRAVFNRKAPGQLDLFLTIVTSREDADPVARARAVLEEAKRKGFRKTRAAGEGWWRDFWVKSFVDLPDKLVENLWYFHLYQLACISRDTVAPGLFGLWFRDEAMWGGAYVGNINLAMTYWPIFTSNHLELGAPYFDTLMAARPAMRQDARQLFGLPGIKAPCYMTPYLQREIAGGCVRYCMSTTPMYAQLFWWHYACSGDREFLAKKGYPFLKETVAFLTHYATKDRDGQYHIGPSFSPEQGPLFAQDPAIDIAYLRYVLKAAIESATLLGVDAEDRRQWRAFLGNLADYPIVDNIMLDTRTSGEMDFRALSENDQAPYVHIRHPGLYSCLYPTAEAGLHNPASPLFKTMEKTFDIRFQQPGVYDRIENHNSFGWTWYACLAAHLGRGDKALELIYDRGVSCQLQSNGMFVQQRNDPIRQTSEPLLLIDGCSGFVTAVNEMLLQSVGGHVVVFPAVPNAWQDCYFKDLLAEGAFAVTARRQDGETRYVALRSIAGNLCRLINPWPNARVMVEDRRTRRRILCTADRVIHFATRQDGEYLLYRSGVRPAVEYRSPSVVPRRSPRHFIWRQGLLGS